MANPNPPSSNVPEKSKAVVSRPNGERKPRTTKGRVRRRIYEEAERNALILLWEAGDRLCGKRLMP